MFRDVISTDQLSGADKYSRLIETGKDDEGLFECGRARTRRFDESAATHSVLRARTLIDNRITDPCGGPNSLILYRRN